FGLNAAITEKQGYTEVAFNSVPLVLWWEACGFAKLPPAAEHAGKGWHSHIPDAVLHTNDREIYAAFVRGLFEADGSTNTGYVSWTTVTETFSRDIQSLLLALGFVTTRKVDGAGSNWGNNDRFVLRLLNVAASERFLTEIGFMSIRREASLWRGDHRQASRHDHIPVSRELVDELAPENDSLRKTMLMSLARRGDVSRRSATALMERTESTELEHLLGFYYDTVATVETLDDEPTYDLSVPDNVTYVANGFVSHNTISFMMDCDTTGVEPDFSLVKSKKLVGGGEITIVNRGVQMALEKLGYAPTEAEEIVAYVDDHNSVVGAPYIKAEHYPVFDCAVGERAIHYTGHVKMMGAVQPFISGAISKTVNVPSDVTPEEIAEAFLQSWKLGLKAVAIYRDGCKRSQPLSTSRDQTKVKVEAAPGVGVTVEAPARAVRRRLPDERRAITHKFSIAGHDGYVTVGMYEDGQPGEIFLVMAKEGSVVSGLMDCFATAVSMALQYGVPLQVLVDKFSHVRFEPSGFSNNPEIPIAKSIVDYIFRWLASKFLNKDQQRAIGVHVKEEGGETAGQPAGETPGRPGLMPVNLSAGPMSTTTITGPVGVPSPRGSTPGSGPSSVGAAGSDPSRSMFAFRPDEDAPPCPDCGSIMVRNAACYKCLNCGATSGCS
ncbi:MAG TPA: LAGLIDADG family homing endonuclease, partial [Candidatus Polarisedimenticolia bacterium]|nr:LAGLIDADG family homing endonuclease [Candidatus Polarisedimenticolia bacterium]